MSHKISWMAALLGMIVLLAACAGEKYAPQAINEETDVCVVCKMAIKDDQYATQIITKDGQSLKFDDIGCMNTWKTENGTDTIGAAFVRDYHSKQWIRYEKAWYAYDASYRTPMAYGIVSFEKEADAQAFIDEQGAGKLMTADDLNSHTWEVNREMMGGHGHSHSAGGEGHGHADGGHGGEDSGHAEDRHGEGDDHAGGHGEDGHSADGHHEGGDADGGHAEDGHGEGSHDEDGSAHTPADGDGHSAEQEHNAAGGHSS